MTLDSYIPKKPENVSFFGIKISGLGQLKATESPLNIKNNAFYFTLKAFFVLQILKYLLRMFSYELDRSSHQRCSGKKVFLEIPQHSQENTYARDSFSIKLQAWPATLLKKSLWHRCFPVNVVEFLRTPFLQNTYERLLLIG